MDALYREERTSIEDERGDCQFWFLAKFNFTGLLITWLEVTVFILGTCAFTWSQNAITHM